MLLLLLLLLLAPPLALAPLRASVIRTATVAWVEAWRMMVVVVVVVLLLLLLLLLLPLLLLPLIQELQRGQWRGRRRWAKRAR